MFLLKIYVRMRDLFEADSEFLFLSLEMTLRHGLMRTRRWKDGRLGSRSGLAALEPLDLEVAEGDVGQVVIDEHILSVDIKLKKLKEWCASWVWLLVEARPRSSTV